MIQLEHVRKRYADFQLQCSLTVNSGCITALIGANGAGKSTLFKAALGLIAHEGNVSLFGERIDQPDERQLERIGVVLADSGFSAYLTLQDVRRILKRMYPGFEEERFLTLCRRLELPMQKKIRTFSTGMRAKLKMVCALTHQAQLLVLDEPTAGLDVLARDELLELLREYMAEDERRSILISSHISSDLEPLCDDVYMIDQGTIVLHEETDVLLDAYGLIKASDEQYAHLDRRYLLRVKREPYGVSCLCRERSFYAENYPGLVIEKGSIDRVMTMMIRGEQV